MKQSQKNLILVVLVLISIFVIGKIYLSEEEDFYYYNRRKGSGGFSGSSASRGSVSGGFSGGSRGISNRSMVGSPRTSNNFGGFRINNARPNVKPISSPINRPNNRPNNRPISRPVNKLDSKLVKRDRSIGPGRRDRRHNGNWGRHRPYYNGGYGGYYDGCPYGNCPWRNYGWNWYNPLDAYLLYDYSDISALQSPQWCWEKINGDDIGMSPMSTRQDWLIWARQQGMTSILFPRDTDNHVLIQSTRNCFLRSVDDISDYDFVSL